MFRSLKARLQKTKEKGQEGARAWGRWESRAGGRVARNRGFCLTVNDSLFKGRTESPQSSQFGPKSWRELHAGGLVKQEKPPADEMPHPIRWLLTTGAAGLTSSDTGGGKDGRGDQQNY